jgi:O-antigen/teichoic acid export membrane protein
MIRESLLYLLASVASRAAGFLMIPFYSSHLTPAEYGTIEVIELATQVVALLIGLNIFGNALNRVFQDAAERHEQNVVASTALLASLGLNLLGTAILATACVGLINRIILPTVDATDLLRLTFVSMFFGNLVELCLCYGRLKLRAAFVSAFAVISLVFTLGFNIYFIAYQHMGVMGFVLSKLLVTGVGSLLLLIITCRETGFHWSQPVAAKMFKFGAPLILANLAFFVLHFGDRFFLSRFSTMTDVGNYSLAYKFGFLVTFLVGEPFGRSWSARYVALMRQDGWQQSFRSASVYLTFALSAVGLSIALFSNEVMHELVTPAYFPSFQAIPFIVLAYAMREFGDFFRNLLYINLRSKLVSAVSMGVALLNCLLNVWLVPHFGMIGAAWSTLATWAIYALALYVYAERDLRIGFPSYSYAGMAALAFAAFALGLPTVSLHVVWQYAADAALLGAFVLLVWKTPILRNAEREGIVHTLQQGRQFLMARFAPSSSV